MSARRIECHGNCGRWWFYTGSNEGKHAGGRPREWCPRCLPLHTRWRKRVDAPNLMAPATDSNEGEHLWRAP